MLSSTPLWTVTDVPVSDRDAADMLRTYFAEVISRYTHHPAGADEIDAAMAEDPSDALAAPSGVSCWRGMPIARPGVWV
ncbi:hypothetical protein [Halopolyspora algeriensis]|uniref:hypothetical protein n=1 Tax=Halopolyspora algeriensis TaxID=1500506 RepID=UPI0030B826E1